MLIVIVMLPRIISGFLLLAKFLRTVN